jgi:hypothetical protein
MSIIDLRKNKYDETPGTERVFNYEPLLGLRNANGRVDMEPCGAELADMDDDERYWHDCQSLRYRSSR